MDITGGQVAVIISVIASALAIIVRAGRITDRWKDNIEEIATAAAHAAVEEVRVAMAARIDAAIHTRRQDFLDALGSDDGRQKVERFTAPLIDAAVARHSEEARNRHENERGKLWEYIGRLESKIGDVDKSVASIGAVLTRVEQHVITMANTKKGNSNGAS